jgi:predicted RNA binding protein YcfA (HicA-like mRNA interferase family)
LCRRGKYNAIKTTRDGENNLCRWIFKNQEGSHRNYVHPIKPGKVTIPFHQGKELNKKTENSIRKQAGLR